MCSMKEVCAALGPLHSILEVCVYGGYASERLPGESDNQARLAAFGEEAGRLQRAFHQECLAYTGVREKGTK